MPRPDVDNYAKAVMDCANGVVWKDDSQVRSLEIEKAWSKTPGSGYIEISVQEDA